MSADGPTDTGWRTQCSMGACFETDAQVRPTTQMARKCKAQ